MKNTVVIGLGNPILSDDAVGVRVAQALRAELADSESVEIKELYAGGMRVMDAVAGFDKAVIVDAMQTGSVEPGSIRVMDPADLGASRNLASTHDTDLPTALELGRMLGLPMPREVKIYGIEAREVEDFGQVLSTEVERAVPEAVRLIAKEVTS